MTTVAPAATESTLVTDDGARLAVTVLAPLGAASGRTVVLVHGWAAARRVWGTVADRLIRQGHRVVLYDLRGHGASTLGREPFSVPRLGADLGAVVEHVEASGAIVVGHSGGGFAAMAYAASPGARVGGLVLLGTAAHDQDTPDSEVKMMGSPVFSWAVRRPALGRLLLGQNMLGKRADARAGEVNRQIFAATSPQMRSDAFASTRGMDLRTDLARISAPAVVLAGGADKVIAPALGRTVADTLPGARFEQLEGAGHMLPLEAPEEVVRAVEEVSGGVG